MAYLTHNIPPIEVYIRKSYLYENGSASEYEEGVAFAIKSIPGHAIYFSVMTELGGVYDKLPISALAHKIPTQEQRFDILQLWDSFSYNITCIQYSYLKNKRARILLKDKNQYEGQYLFSLDWSAQSTGELDTSMAELSGQHKQGHLIALENGNFCLQPNNRILWNDPTLVPRPFETVPKYKLAEKIYSCEYYEKWAADSDLYFYGVNND